MKIIVADWGEDSNESRYTLHSTDTCREIDIFLSLDQIGDPEDAEIRKYHGPKLDEFWIKKLERYGYIDSERFEKTVKSIWDAARVGATGLSRAHTPAKPFQTVEDSLLDEIAKLKAEKESLLNRLARKSVGLLTEEEFMHLADQYKPTPKKLYLMKDSNTDLYKIGVSISPKKIREKTLQSEKPTTKLIFSTHQTDDFNEKVLHKRYADQRVRGEWFSLSKAQVRLLVKEARSRTDSLSETP